MRRRSFSTRWTTRSSWRDDRRADRRHKESGRAITIPVHEGRRGHPIVCDRKVVEEFMRSLRMRPRARSPGGIRARPGTPVEDAEVLRDLDTPADYHAALEVYSARAARRAFSHQGRGQTRPEASPV